MTLGENEDESLVDIRSDEDTPAVGKLGVLGLQGHIDAIESGRIYGWAWNPEKPDQRISIDIYLRGDLIGSVLADRFRQDLMDIKVGDGNHAFVFDLPVDERDADPASVSVYFTETQMPLSRGGPSQLLVPVGEEDLETTLSGRIDRIEASIQQMFRVLHIIRRSDDEGSRGAGLQELETLQAELAGISAREGDVVERLKVLETEINAARSFIDRFDIEIHDRISRSEIEDLQLEMKRSRAAVRVLLVLVLALAAVIGYAAFTQ